MTDAPLAGHRVVVPRGGDWGAHAAELLRGQGAEPVLLPLIATVPPADPGALLAAVDRLAAGAYDWLVITSATTVSALLDAAHELGAGGLLVPEGTRVAAVGPATAAALAAVGVPVDYMPRSEYSAGAVVAEWPDASAGGPSGGVAHDRRRVLVPASAIADPGLAEGLRAKGMAVDTVAAYSTVTATPDAAAVTALADRGIHAVLVTSGSVARAVAQLLPGLPSTTTIACIGPRTAAEAREAGLRVDVVASLQTVEALVDGLAAHIAGTAGAASAPLRRARIRTANRFRGVTAMPFPTHRPRRLRTSPAMRRLVAETRLHPAQLILPMFIREGLSEPAPIGSMPGVVQHSLDSFRAALHEAAEAGLGGVMLFGVPEHKDAIGSGATDEFGILNVATRLAAAEVGDALVVQTDLCLDEFTDHGHCGVLDHAGRIDNDATLDRYREMAIAQASAGSALLGLSGMMDGQVAAVRDALDGEGFAETAVLGYAAKYASAFYGPFREAVASSLQGDRRTYQQDPANRREGMREAQLDLDEGADIIMVKPAMGFLDVLAEVAKRSSVPVWAYQVSGEYAMIEAAAANGWIDRDAAILESLVSIRRAGADAVLSYWALEAARAVR